MHGSGQPKLEKWLKPRGGFWGVHLPGNGKRWRTLRFVGRTCSSAYFSYSSSSHGTGSSASKPTTSRWSV